MKSISRGPAAVTQERAAFTLDAALLGFVIAEHATARDVTPEWFRAPRWQHAAHALVRHRDTGGQLGDIIVAGAVLDAAGVPFPRSTAAEAVIAAQEAVPAVWLIRARERLVRLRLYRLGRRLKLIARADIDVIPAQVALVRDALGKVAA